LFLSEALVIEDLHNGHLESFRALLRLFLDERNFERKCFLIDSSPGNL